MRRLRSGPTARLAHVRLGRSSGGALKTPSSWGSSGSGSEREAAEDPPVEFVNHNLKSESLEHNLLPHSLSRPI